MANYDGDITLTVDLEPGDIKSTTESLQKQVREVFNTPRNGQTIKGFKQLQTNMAKSYQKAEQLLQKMKDIEKRRVPSKEYGEWQNYINSLVKQLEKAKEKRKEFEAKGQLNTKEYHDLNRQTGELVKNLTNARNQVKAMEQNGTAFSPLTSQQAQQYEELANQLNNVNNQLTVYIARANETPDTSGKVNKEQSAFDRLRSTIHKVLSVLKTLGTGLRTVASKLVQVASAAAKAAANLIKMAGSSIVKGIRSLTGHLGKLVSSLRKTNKSTDSASDAFKKGLKTLIKYTFGVRSFFFLWRKMRKALSEGIGNLAQYSAPFNNVISDFISALTRLKNSFATAFAPIMNVVVPILTTFINVVSDVVTKIGMLIAALTGQTTFIRAKAVQEDYAASLDKAAGSASDAAKANKEYEKTIAGFDDVEILKDPTKNASGSGGSGGSGGGGGVSPEDMFETVGIPEAFHNWAEMIKKAWEEADFTSLGEILGGKIANILANLPWEDIQKNASNFGQSFATFVNGVISVDGLATTVGSTIGEAINTGLALWEGFIDPFNFDDLGVFIGEAMNGMVITTDWDLLADNVVATANGVFNLASTWADTFNFDAMGDEVEKTITSVLNGISWDDAETAAGKIASGIADALNKIMTEDTFKAVGKAIGSGINMAITGVTNFVSGIKWDNWGKNLASGVNTFFETVNWKKLKVTFDAVAEALAKGIKAACLTTNTFLSNIDWDAVATTLSASINVFFSNLDWDVLGVTFNNAARALAKGIKAACKITNTFLSGIEWDKVATTLSSSINIFFNNLNWGELEITFNNVASALAKGIKTAISTIHTLITDISWTDLGKALGTSVNTFFKDINWAEIGVTFDDFLNGIIDGLSSILITIDFETVGADIATALTSVDWDKLIKKLGETIVITKDALKAFLDGLFGGLQDAFDQWLADKFGVDISELQPAIDAREEEARLQREYAENFKWPWEEGFKWPWEEGDPPTANVTLTAEKDQSYIDNIDNDYDKTGDKPVKATADGGVTNKWGPLFGDPTSVWKQLTGKTVVATADGTTTTNYDSKIKGTNNSVGYLNLPSTKTVKATADGATTTNYDSKITGTKNSTGYLSVPATRDVKATADGATTTNYNNKIVGGNDRKDGYVSLPATRDVKVTADGGTTPNYDSTIKGTNKTNDGSYLGTKDKTVTLTAEGNLTDYYKTTIKDPNNPKGGYAGLLDRTVTLTADAKKTNNYKAIVTGEQYKTKKGKKVNTTGLLEIPSEKTSTLKADADKTKTFTSVTDTLSGIPKTKEVLVKINGGITSAGRTALKAMVDIEEGATQTAYKRSQNIPTREALGGAFFGGAWHNIAQYATGGIPTHGTVFVAGEAGAEAVGHIGNRTEVLNQSQMAAVMYSAVLNGTASLVKTITNYMALCTNTLISNIGTIISQAGYISSQLAELHNLGNVLTTTLTDIVVGKIIPSTYTNNANNNTLNKILDVLQYNQSNMVTRDELEVVLRTSFERYMNIGLYIGDEQIARHANAGNAKLNYRFSPVR